jgi:Domain of Unknown Function (DUF1080).|nr:DUF1080 domain-containing protein [uncultured Steroidobacter sp.]
MLTLACALLGTSSVFAQSKPTAPTIPAGDWIELFNGRDLTGWTPKISKHALGENFADTFRVRDGLLQVRYDEYRNFDNQFGHLFYQTPYSYYRLVVEYRFVGEQAKGGPGAWAFRNSGMMIHAQDPKTMTRDQDFPISIEAQLLGGKSDGSARPTLNVCTPGTEIVVDGSLYPEHCLNSRSRTYDGDQWVRVELLVLGAGQIAHIVDGQKVLEYALPQFGGGVVHDHDPAAQPTGKLMKGGYIALQSESHPIDFRRISLLNLAGCMDPKAGNYRSYYVKSAPATCQYARPAATP